MPLDERRRACLNAMGVVVWRERSGHEVPVGKVEPADARLGRSAGSVLDRLRGDVAECTRCVLHETRTQTVFGVGDPAARLMIIGEAPGADEDAQGKPFVGRAGQLLNAMLAAIGLEREQVFIANILKCRPPRNRDPRPEEVASCSGYLNSQIDAVSPELILAVGRIAAQNLLQVTTPIGKLRGREHVHPATGTPMLVTYHPAYLLRSPREKRKSWDDLKRVARHLEIGF